MSARTLIGKVSATEKTPSSCDEFQFWLSDDIMISPFDIVVVENEDESVTYGVVQDILHITDGTGHIGNYVSSDFGSVDTKPLTKRLALSFAKVSVIHNSHENYMPVKEARPVRLANEEDIQVALGLDDIKEKSAISAGLMKASNNVSVPIKFNGDFLIGPEGAHLNMSGISGLATKTSYIMFLLKAIQYRHPEEVAIIVMNVKGNDLLRLHEENRNLSEAQIQEWNELGVPCEPFKDVTYLYPYRQNKEQGYSNTALSVEELITQQEEGRAKNYVFSYEHDIDKLDMLFTNVDDPNWTIESILNFIETNDTDFGGDLDWGQFKDRLREFCDRQGSVGKDKSITIQSWRRFNRLINNSINNDIFVNSLAGTEQLHQTYLSDELLNINAGEVKVVDIAGLDEQLQCFVFGDVIRAVYALKHGDFSPDDRKSEESVPKKIILFVDELNKYAPTASSKSSPLLANLLDITERGRSEGVILFSAEQFRSAIHDRIKGNCGTNVYGRTNAIEISKPDYKYIPNVYKNMMTRLSKGDLIIQHPIFRTLLKVRFPMPSYRQGGDDNE